MSEKVPVPAEKVPAPASGAREPDWSWEGIVAAAKSAKDSPFATPGSVRVAVDTGNMTAVADHNTKETALWTKIKAAHRSCMGAAVATLRWAYVAGYLLSLAKLKTERGEWLPKLNAIGISSPTLNLYLTVYDNWSTLEGVDIPLREVKGYLAQPPDQRGQGRPVSEKQAEVSRLAKLVLEKGKDIVNDKGALAVARLFASWDGLVANKTKKDALKSFAKFVGAVLGELGDEAQPPATGTKQPTPRTRKRKTTGLGTMPPPHPES